MDKKKVERDRKIVKKYFNFIFVLCLLVIIISLVGGGFFSGIWNEITGAVTGTTELGVTVGNSAPTIYAVQYLPTSPASVESTTTQINITFQANDTDGGAQLPSSGSMGECAVHFNSSEGTRANSTCRYKNDITGDTGSKNYSCTVYMQFFDAAASWVINVSINDTNSATGRNDSVTFAYGSTLAIDTEPASLIWSSFGVTAINQQPTNAPFKVNNTANQDITKINMTAIDLGGNTTTSEYIYATNFTVGLAGCDEGIWMVNKTNTTAGVSEWSTLITGAAVKHGNRSTEDLYLCIEAVNSALSAQTYNATGSNAWTVKAE